MHRISILHWHLFPSSESSGSAELKSGYCSGDSSGILAGQVAVITGSGQGIGAATARLFARQGCSVVVTDIDGTKSDAVANEILSAGGQALSFPGDVTDPSFPSRILEATVKRFGKLNVLVNNAGFTLDRMLHTMTDAEWELMHNVHETAPFRMIRASAPYLRDTAKKELESGQPFKENRVIINISSTSGIHGNVGQANYSTAKMGVLGLTKTTAKEWSRFGIRCNAIAFGPIDTRLTAAKDPSNTIKVDGKVVPLGIPKGSGLDDLSQIPLGRKGTADEAAGSILIMASPYASYITGHCLEVTGGFGM